MSRENNLVQLDTGNVREMLSGSGYSERAIAYYLNKPNMGFLSDADQVTELTGECGDTMKVYLKLEGDRIKDRFLVRICLCWPCPMPFGFEAVAALPGRR